MSRMKYQFADRSIAESAYRAESQKALELGWLAACLLEGQAESVPFGANGVDGDRLAVCVVRFHAPSRRELAYVRWSFGGTPQWSSADEFLAMCDKEVSTLGREYDVMGAVARGVRQVTSLIAA